MIESAQDAVLMFGILATLITLTAGVLRSPVLGAFGGIIFIFLGAFSFLNDIGFGSMNNAFAITIAFLGVFILYNAVISVAGGG